MLLYIDTPLQVPTLEKGTEHCLKISVCMLLELIFFKLNVAMHVIKISFLNSLILGNETMEFSKRFQIATACENKGKIQRVCVSLRL